MSIRLWVLTDGHTYTVRHLFNGPGEETTRSRLSREAAAAHARFLWGCGWGQRLRTDWIEIEDEQTGAVQHLMP